MEKPFDEWFESIFYEVGTMKCSGLQAHGIQDGEELFYVKHQGKTKLKRDGVTVFEGKL